MINFASLVVVAALSMTIATPVRAQYSWKTGSETATKPWSAPIGHRQPRAIDVPASTAPILDREDAQVDRKISGVCRGC
jgi:hypothetical protein